jgi:hypothetical protein
VAQWARDHDVDAVAFHRYVPIANSFEEAPTAEELGDLADRLKRWAAKQDRSPTITLDGRALSRPQPSRRRAYADPVKQRFVGLISAIMAPMEESERNADPASICVAPDHYIEIGLEGQIASCCRAQDVTLGFATSPESFAQAWFGNSYRRIRNSLKRSAQGPLPLANCEGCIRTFAPASLRGRRAIDYESGNFEERLDYSGWSELPMEVIQKEGNHCYIAVMPPGATLTEYTLFENNRALGPPACLHDDIRQYGEGRYSVWGRFLYFSTSDNTDPRNNGRKYMLKASTADR